VVSLEGYEQRRRSQNGEDGVIAEILRRVGAPGRFFVEFGAEEGREGNCAALAEDGWSGLYLEADAAKFAVLEANWRHRPEVGTRHALVEPETIEALFAEAAVPTEPDVLSIDVDSTDWYLWEALVSYRPRLVVVEYNASLPLDRQLVRPPEQDGWDGTDYFGASLGAFEALGQRKGYALVHTEQRGVNAFFVRHDLLPGTGLPWGGAVQRHRANYYDSGRGHPRDPRNRPWVDLGAGGALVRRTRPRLARLRRAWDRILCG
jgi:hypothetical protein